jgi:DNA-binding NarL/FixJ family response regulator
VLELLVRGATNRQIAEHLVVSIKTVESHMTHIRGKTRLRVRGEVIVLFGTPWAPTHHYVPVSADEVASCF